MQIGVGNEEMLTARYAHPYQKNLLLTGYFCYPLFLLFFFILNASLIFYSLLEFGVSAQLGGGADSTARLAKKS